MNSQPVSRIEEVTRSRLVTIHAHAVPTEVAALMSSTQISLVVVCDADGGAITKTDLVKRMAEGLEGASTAKAADVMTRQVRAVPAERSFASCSVDDGAAWRGSHTGG